jgi:hypothetical protein
VLCDVESLARGLREADLDLEDAPMALGAAEGAEGAVRRVYAAGNRFARLRRILEDAGFERVEVDGTPEAIRLQLTLDAIDLCHRSPGARFVLVAEPGELGPLLERLAGYGREVALFDPATAAGRPKTGVVTAREPVKPGKRTSHRPAPELEGHDELGEDFEEEDEEDFEEDLEVDFEEEIEDAFEDEGEDEGEEEDEDQEEEPRVDRRAAGAREDVPRQASGDRGAPPRREQRRALTLRPRDRDDPFDLLLGAIERIVQGPPRLVFESVVRQEILEMEPRFNERSAGFGSFTELFEEAQERGLVQLRREPATGTYVVTAARLELG